MRTKILKDRISKMIEIKEEYSKVYADMISKNNFIRPTQYGYYGPAPADAVFNMFIKIKLDKKKSFVDLGSGDGKIVLIANLFTKATGIEIDKKLNDTAEEIKKKLNIKNAKFINGDYLNADLSKFDVIFINPDNPFYELEKKLRKEMKNNSLLIIYEGIYRPLNMKLVKAYEVNGARFFLYKNK